MKNVTSTIKFFYGACYNYINRNVVIYKLK